MLDRALIEAGSRRRQPAGVVRDAGITGGPPRAPTRAWPRSTPSACPARVRPSTTRSPAGRLSVHVEALRAAGFAEVGTLWQRGDNRLLCGVKGG